MKKNSKQIIKDAKKELAEFKGLIDDIDGAKAKLAKKERLAILKKDIQALEAEL